MRLKNIFARHALSSGTRSAACIAFGVTVGVLLVRGRSFEWDWKLNAVNLLTILMTFVISFGLQQAITHRTSDDRVEKQIIISQFQELETTVRRIADICRASALGELNAAEARGILPEFRSFNNRLDVLGRLFALTPLKPDGKKLGELRRAGLTLKQAATGRRFPTNSTLSLQEWREIEPKASFLSEAIFASIFYINRL